MAGIFMGLFILFYLIMIGVMIAGIWAAFSKANRPGWGCLIPIYNTLLMIDIAGKPWWYLFLLMIPLVGIVFAGIIIHNFVISYGKGVGFTFGLIFLPFVFWPLLGFDDSVYQQQWQH